MAGGMSIHDDIDAERARQRNKWHDEHAWGIGDCSSDHVELPTRVMVLTEEVGEVARAVLDGSPLEHLRAELIQVAAVAVAIIEWIDTP
jgi:NTP pyrophosphatase (non-canonical NTP hydrolase)